MVPPVSGPSPVKGSLWPGAVQRPEVLLAWPRNWVPDCVMVTVPVSTQLTWRLPLETSASRLQTPARLGGPSLGPVESLPDAAAGREAGGRSGPSLGPVESLPHAAARATDGSSRMSQRRMGPPTLGEEYRWRPGYRR